MACLGGPPAAPAAQQQQRRKSSRLLRRTTALGLLLLLLLIPLEPPSYHQRSARLGRFGGGGGALLVSAIYLEEVGRFSQVLSAFVDALLEKVGLLAEIVIESSMDEQCAPFIGDCASSNNNNNSGAPSRWMNTMPATTTAATTTTSKGEHEREESQFGAEESLRGEPSGQCSFLGLPIEPADLPVAAMAACCATFDGCYARCGRPKLSCDAEFRACLMAICKQKFDHKNQTILAAELARIRLAEQRNELAPDDDNSEPELDGLSDSSRMGSRELQSLRDKHKACRLASKVLIIGNLAFGCRNYKRRQRFACCRL